MFPILKALRHHKTTVVLVVLEIALTCAIITNALFIIGHRLQAMQVQTGVDDAQLVWAQVSGLDSAKGPPKPHLGQAAADLAALRSMPGVESAVITNSLPLTDYGWLSCVQVKPGDDKQSRLCNVASYQSTSGMVRTLGIHLVEGRDFLPQEYVDYNMFGGTPPPSAVIVTRAFANRLWPGEDPLGKSLYLGPQGKYVAHVVGVAGHLLSPGIGDPAKAQWNMLMPVKTVAGGMYVVRTTPQARDSVYRDLPKVLEGLDANRIVTERHIYAQTVSDYFHNDRALIWVLVLVVGCLLALTALGVVGLSSFWVQERTRSIGIRRAIGATRRDILRYFLTENFMIVSGGIGLGLAGAVGLNLWLMKHYELVRLPADWLPYGALMLWVLGLLAALGPALRASRVPPVVATRSV